MHPRTSLAVSLVLIATGAVAVAAAGCSSTESKTDPKADASTPRDGSTQDGATGNPDGSTGTDADTTGDGSSEGVVATGTKVVAGNHEIIGVTSDDHIVFKDLGENAVKAVPAAGGTALTLATNARTIGEDTGVVISGKVVFVWTDMDFEHKGRLRAWSQAAGTPKELAVKSQYGAGASRAVASVDGTRVVFTFVQTDADGGSTLDLQGATLGSGAPTPTSLITNIETTNACSIELAFAGNGTAIASACAAGTTTRVVRAFDAAGSFAGRTLFDSGDADNATIRVSASGNRVLLLGSNGGGAGTSTAVVVGLDGDAGAVQVVANNVSDAFLSADGNTVVYRNGSGGLHRRIIGGADTELLNAGVEGILAVSGDLRWALTYSESASNNAGTNDAGEPITFETVNVHLASLELPVSSPLVPTTIGSAGPNQFPGGDGFTKDGTHALYFSGVTASGSGSLYSRALGDAGSSTRSPATGAVKVWAVTGSKILFVDNVKGTDTSARADLKAFDTSGTSDTATVIATRTAGFPSANPTGTLVTYSSPNAPSGAGIYVANMP